MKLNIKRLDGSAKNFMRACSYVEIVNPHTKETSYVRSLHPGRFYPRFHIHIQKLPDQTNINLHLDAKKPSYEGAKAHSGEYEGSIIEKEIQRIKGISERFILKTDTSKSIGFEEKKSLWQKIKGLLK